MLPCLARSVSKATTRAFLSMIHNLQLLTATGIDSVTTHRPITSALQRHY